ncbi:hypothetical protein N9W12_06850 [Luminiphilus sp.]|nr:hypothetical protein [Luminiphilus sp.]
MKKIILAGVVISTVLSCATIEEIRKREPAFKATANQDVIEFRDCVADITSARFGSQSVNKFSQGITLGREPTVSVLIEQVDEVVYVYELGDLLMHRKLPVKAAQGCNKNPNIGILDLD